MSSLIYLPCSLCAVYVPVLTAKYKFFAFFSVSSLISDFRSSKLETKKKNIMSIGSKLKYARTFLGKTQTEMGEAIGKTKQGWQTYERGSSIPGGQVFEELSKLGFNVGWFFSDDVPMLLADMQKNRSTQTTAADQTGINKEPISKMPSDDLGLGQSVELLAKIYNSGNTVLVRAIAANLHAFSEAVDNKALAQRAIDMMDEMNKRVLTLENKLAHLEKENEELKRKPPDNKQQAMG